MHAGVITREREQSGCLPRFLNTNDHERLNQIRNLIREVTYLFEQTKLPWIEVFVRRVGNWHSRKRSQLPKNRRKSEEGGRRNREQNTSDWYVFWALVKRRTQLPRKKIQHEHEKPREGRNVKLKQKTHSIWQVVHEESTGEMKQLIFPIMFRLRPFNALIEVQRKALKSLRKGKTRLSVWIKKLECELS